MISDTYHNKNNTYRFVKAASVLSLVLLLMITGTLGDVVAFFHPERIQTLLKNSGFLAPLVYMAIMALAIVISPIPSVPLDVAAGIFFGPVWGTLYSAIGASAGAVVSFLLARFFGQKFLERFLRSHINICTQCSNKLLTKLIFLSRLIPFVSFDIISYGAGLTKMSLRNFTLATFLGMLPLTFVYNYFGAILISGRFLPLILGVMVIFLFFLLPRWIERYNLFSLRQFFQHGEQSTREK